MKISMTNYPTCIYFSDLDPGDLFLSRDTLDGRVCMKLDRIYTISNELESSGIGYYNAIDIETGHLIDVSAIEYVHKLHGDLVCKFVDNMEVGEDEFN